MEPSDPTERTEVKAKDQAICHIAKLPLELLDQIGSHAVNFQFDAPDFWAVGGYKTWLYSDSGASETYRKLFVKHPLVALSQTCKFFRSASKRWLRDKQNASLDYDFDDTGIRLFLTNHAGIASLPLAPQMWPRSNVQFLEITIRRGRWKKDIGRYPVPSVRHLTLEVASHKVYANSTLDANRLVWETFPALETFDIKRPHNTRWAEKTAPAHDKLLRGWRAADAKFVQMVYDAVENKRQLQICLE